MHRGVAKVSWHDARSRRILRAWLAPTMRENGVLRVFRKGMTLMVDKVRLNLQLSPEMNRTLEDIAEQTGANRTDVIRQALALMKAAHEAKLKNRHLGWVADATKLDTEIVGLL